MARIRYLAYHFNKPSGSLDDESYEHIRSLSPAHWEEYVAACATAAWDKFKKDHSKVIKIVCVGGPIALFCLLIPGVNVVAIIYLMVAFFGSLSLGMSASSHVSFVRSYRGYLKKVRGQIVRSRSYEDYLSLYACERL